MNKKIDNNLKNTKNAPQNTSDNKNRNNSTKNTDQINNNMKNRKTPVASQSRSPTAKPIRVSRIQRDRNYIVLVWQSKTNGIIRRVMEVPGTELNRTLNNIRDQRKAFDYYLKR